MILIKEANTFKSKSILINLININSFFSPLIQWYLDKRPAGCWGSECPDIQPKWPDIEAVLPRYLAKMTGYQGTTVQEAKTMKSYLILIYSMDLQKV